MIRIFVIFKSRIFIEAITPFLKECNIEIAGLCLDSFRAVSQYKEINADLVIMDLNWTHQSYTVTGPELIRNLRQYNPDVKIIGVTNFHESRVLDKLSQLCVQAHFSRDMPLAGIIQCIREVCQPGRIIPDLQNNRLDRNLINA
ncbi:MAG: response regulator [Chitinophagaceae bacterium]